jgi:RND family efflux transporter MFP subunit
VGAGQTIVTLADPTTRDVVIDVPEAIVDQIGTGTSFVIAPQLAPDVRVAGRVREIAPQAHPVTRTWRVKIAIDQQAEQFWLGTTATAAIEGSRGDRLSVPASAIRREGAQAFVFVLDEAAAQVRKRPVEIEEPGTDGRAVVTAGLEAGEAVVIAGVNSLGDGQQVKLTQESAK